MTGAGADVYYDPYDFEIDSDPYPVWKRLRDERPLYYNERYDFYALSRFEDVERGLVDWRTYVSSKGTLLEIIKSGMEIPPGSIIFEDPPTHDVHRGLLSRVFTPRKMNAIEPKVREFCARCLDPLVGAGGFDFIRDLGAQMPMRTIGMRWRPTHRPRTPTAGWGRSRTPGSPRRRTPPRGQVPAATHRTRPGQLPGRRRNPMSGCRLRRGRVL